jgi:hypothetical protein
MRWWVKARSGKTIILDDSAWNHIVEEHSEMIYYENKIYETIRNPDDVEKGRKNRLIAVKFFDDIKFYIKVVYIEFRHDGKVITAYLQ